MRFARAARTFLGIAVVLQGLYGAANAGSPAVPMTPPPVRSFPSGAQLLSSLEPLPEVEIPDNPPPHEGAMLQTPYLIDVPDHLQVEVLEALPGRPISGERLVRPDGTISLGFYGSVHVRGLTVEQAKVKILLHLRNHMPDETLGLFKVDEPAPPRGPAPPPPDLRDPTDAPPPPARGPFDLDTPPPGSQGAARPPRGAVRMAPRSGLMRLAAQQNPRRVNPPIAPQAPKGQNKAAAGKAQSARTPAAAPPTVRPLDPVPDGMEGVKVMSVHPADSDRVFVDVAAYNSKSYYVMGDVAKPGRMPVTGNETVLDAINYAGDLLATADPKDIRLARPGRAGKPTRVFPVDLEAILAGDAKKNYQIFPGDRILVGRNALVQSTIEIDRIAAALQNPMNTMLSASLLMRSLSQTASGGATSGAPISVRIRLGNLTWVFDAGARAPDLSDAQRDAIIKGWADFWWKTASKAGGANLDEKTFREALMRGMVAPPSSQPGEKK